MNILEKLRSGAEKSLYAQIKSGMKLQEQRIHRAVEGIRDLPIPSAVSLFAAKQPAAPRTDIQNFIQEAKKNRNPHGYAEIDRIINHLGLSYPLTDRELEAYCAGNILSTAYARGFRLKMAQAEAFLAYEMYGVCFAPIGAGAGKTLVDVGLASRAYVRGIDKILLLIPPHVYYQFVARSLPWIRNQIPVQVPFICMGATTRSKRLAMANSNRAGCYVLPYSCLSTEDSVDVLNAIKPGLIIADEAHRISSRRAARTRRIAKYIDEHDPGFIPLSGTITGKTVMEYHHLISWAMGVRSPLPRSAQMAAEWGQYIDAKAEYTGGEAGPIKLIVDWARQHFPKERIDEDIQGFRTAYRMRLVSAPGVVSTADSEVATSLYLCNEPADTSNTNKAEWDKLNQLIKQVVDSYTTPNGDTIEHAIHTFRWLYELSSGFYNELVWPTTEAYAKRKGIPAKEAADIIARAQDHHDLSQIFAKLLRVWLRDHHRDHIDTPLLVRSDMQAHGAKNVGHELYDAWRDVKAAEFEGMPERDSNAIRVCDYKVKAAAKWAGSLPKGEGGIIWAWNQELVQWMHELIPGSVKADAGEESIGDPANAGKVYVASIAAHGEGKELQHFQHQYFAQWPRGARMAEQALARLHRLGQKADELTAVTNNTTLFDQMNFAACLIDALYIQQTTGNRQRVIYAGYDPLPVIFPPSVLRERGMNNKMLSTEHQQVLKDLFGDSSS